MLVFVIHPVSVKLISKEVSEKLDPGTGLRYNPVEKGILGFSLTIRVLAMIYSVFVPLTLGTAWFYTGLAIYLLVLIALVITTANWITTPHDKPITKGIYRYSRHPMYVTGILGMLGVSMASTSWIFLFLTAAFAVSWLILAIPEERFVLKNTAMPIVNT